MALLSPLLELLSAVFSLGHSSVALRLAGVIASRRAMFGAKPIFSAIGRIVSSTSSGTRSPSGIGTQASDRSLLGSLIAATLVP
jgi:hypothetical protein